MEDEKLAGYFGAHSKFITIGFIVALWIATLVMFLLMSCGIYKAGLGMFLEFKGEELAGLIKILGGLELIFVSPLIYLLVLSLTKYISATRPEIDKIGANSSPHTKRKFINFAMMEIINVKTLIVGLFISILTLHSIQFILEDVSHSLPTIFIVAIFAILIVYYFVLDHLAEGLRFPKE